MIPLQLFCSENNAWKASGRIKEELNKAVGYKGIQLVTISRPTAYGEYAKELWIDRREKRKSLDRQGTVCCAWEKTAFEEVLKVGMRLMVEVLGV